MKVFELVELLAQFSFSNSSTDKQRKVFLRCLNLANIQLYQRILDSNQFFKSLDVELDADFKFQIPDDVFYLKKIYNNNKPLKAYDLTSDNLALSQGEYYREGDIIFLSGSVFQSKVNHEGRQVNFVKIIYIPYPKKLVENTEDHDLETDTPVYSLPFHFTLVQGALYHVLVSTKGYAEKTNMQYAAYIESRKNFDRYYGIK